MRAVLVIALSTMAAMAMAVDDAAIVEIDNKASSANAKADGNNSRIQALEAEVAALHQRIDNVGLAYLYGGPVAATNITQCLDHDRGEAHCSEKTRLHLNVPEGIMMTFDLIEQLTIIKDGEPAPFEQTTTVEATNLPRANGPGNELKFTLTREGDDDLTFALTREAPFYRHDSVDIKLNAGLLTDSQAVLTMDAGTIKHIRTESIGVINSAAIVADSFTPGSTDAQLSVEIENWDERKTDYVVTVTDFNVTMAAQVPPQAGILSPYGKAILTFDLQNIDGFQPGDRFLVSLGSPTGREYDSIQVVFP